MNEVTKISAGGLYVALSRAQAEMTKAAKDTKNEHFKSRYADLASVMDACMPALSRHGIAVLQPTFEDERGRFVKTILVHGETGEMAECSVPLLVGKNDMQGYGSAVTYARRYGLMCMAGVAPDDDDGNAAAKSPAVVDLPKARPAKIGVDQFLALSAKAEEAGVSKDALAHRYKVSTLDELSVDDFIAAMKGLDGIIAKKPKQLANADLGGDTIPY